MNRSSDNSSDPLNQIRAMLGDEADINPFTARMAMRDALGTAGADLPQKEVLPLTDLDRLRMCLEEIHSYRVDGIKHDPEILANQWKISLPEGFDDNFDISTYLETFDNGDTNVVTLVAPTREAL